MNCNDFKQSIDDLMDDTLPPPATAAAQDHLDQCPDCRATLEQAQQLQQTLRSLPAPEPAADFFDQAIQQAAAAHRRRSLLRFGGFGSAIAAGLLLFAVNLPLLQPQHSYQPPVADHPLVTIALHETRDVRLVFNAEQALQDTRFTLQLPPEIELRGFPGQRQISWTGTLKQGQNLLILPVTAQSNQGGELTARIENAGKTEQFTVRMKINDRQATLPGARINNDTATILS